MLFPLDLCQFPLLLLSKAPLLDLSLYNYPSNITKLVGTCQKRKTHLFDMQYVRGPLVSTCTSNVEKELRRGWIFVGNKN